MRPDDRGASLRTTPTPRHCNTTPRRLNSGPLVLCMRAHSLSARLTARRSNLIQAAALHSHEARRAPTRARFHPPRAFSEAQRATHLSKKHHEIHNKPDRTPRHAPHPRPHARRRLRADR